jgi:hypothetical protein
MIAPQLPFAADPGSITGWMLETAANDTTTDISNHMARGLNRLASIPAVGHANHNRDRRAMIDEIINSDSMEPYLVVSNTPHNAPRITVVHSIGRYSAGFGGSNALHGRELGLLGEMVDDQLPTMVQFLTDADLGLAHGLLLEDVTVQPTNATDAYFATATALEVMPAVTEANGGVNMHLSCL